MTDLSHPRHADEVAAVFDYDRLRSGMPVSGQSRRFDRVPPTSALLPKTDIHREGRHVSNVPIGDIGQEIYLREEQKPEALVGQTAISGIDRHDIIQMAIEPT